MATCFVSSVLLCVYSMSTETNVRYIWAVVYITVAPYTFGVLLNLWTLAMGKTSQDKTNKTSGQTSGDKEPYPLAKPLLVV